MSVVVATTVHNSTQHQIPQQTISCLEQELQPDAVVSFFEVELSSRTTNMPSLFFFVVESLIIKLLKKGGSSMLLLSVFMG